MCMKSKDKQVTGHTDRQIDRSIDGRIENR